MSHYSVAVFTDEDTTVEELLEPFDESIEVEKYIFMTKEELIKQGKEDIKFLLSMYKKYIKDKRKYRREHQKDIEHLRFIKKVPYMKKWDKEKIYKFAIRLYDKEKISNDGGIYSTYNPNSKWDCYEEGGRWKNKLLIKSEQEDGQVKESNSALVKEIDWEKMKEMKFSTYAILTPDGEWHEPGPMGWWGIPNATNDEIVDFKDNYYEKFIKSANPDWNLTIVDCHI